MVQCSSTVKAELDIVVVVSMGLITLGSTIKLPNSRKDFCSSWQTGLEKDGQELSAVVSWKGRLCS